MASFIAPPGSTFNIAEAIVLDGALVETLFMRALSMVAEEAETLRACIEETDAGPTIRVRETIPAVFPLLDLRDEADPSLAARQWMDARIRVPIALDRDVLWQNALIRIGDEAYIWFHCCHHAILDGYSGGLIAARVAAIYSALVSGSDVGPTPFLPLCNLLEQEAAYSASERREADRAYWLDHLSEPPEPVTLSLAPQRRPSGENGGFISRSLRFPPSRLQQLADMAKSLDVTLPQALTAMAAAYLQRVTGASDLVVGMPVSGRANRVLRNTPGMVANAVALRFRFQPDTSFTALMVQARRAMRGALRHQQFRYEDLRRELGLFEISQQVARIGINIEPFDYKLDFGGIQARNGNLSNGAMEDLTIFMFDRQDGDGLVIQFDANPALYHAEELDDHLGRLNHLAGFLITEPDAPIASHDVLTDEDRAEAERRARVAFRAWPENRLLSMLDSIVLDGRGPPAVIDAQGELSRGELMRQSRLLARRLIELGAGAGEIVAIALPRDRRMVIAMLAVAMSGAAWMPVDLDGPVSRARTILEDASPALVIAADEAALELGQDRKFLLMPDGCMPVRGTVVAGSHGTFTPRSEPLPADSAYVTYTSGTTGRPKGVVVPHAALANLLYAMRETLEADRHLCLLAVTTLTFDIAALELLLPLVMGGSVVIATRGDVQDPSRISRMLECHSVNTMQATPTLWQSLLTDRDGAAMRGMTLLTGGEMLPGHLARRLFRLSPAVFNLYGPTETTIWSTAHRLTAADLDDPPVGKPIANTELFILDPAGRPLPDGVVGELAIGGAGVASFYLGRAELTAGRFVSDPLGRPGRRAYRTGDRAARAKNGVLRLFGRNDDQVKIRGMRIEPGEVETALVALAVVAQAAVLAERDTPQSAPILAAYVVPTEPAMPLDPAAIRQALLAQLPPQMVPTRMVPVQALPRTAAGKLDRAALRHLESAPAETGAVLARTTAERMLSDLWSSLLGLREIDIHTSFFDLGGDSLMVLQLISALAERGFELPIGQIFGAPTIAALAPHFEHEAEQRDPFCGLLPIRGGHERTPIFCIHPVIGLGWGFSGLASLLPERYPVYALQHAKPVLEDRAASDLCTLARMHLKEIRNIQPSGPYHLLGWSMGGLLAHAIAGILQRERETVAMLALLDAYPYQEHAARQPMDSPETVRAVMDFLSIDLPAGMGMPATLEELADTILAVELAQVPTQLRGHGSTIDKLASDLRRITLHNVRLVRSFKPKPTELDMIFVRASQRGGSGADSIVEDSVDVWSRHNTGAIRHFDLDCRHQDMLQPGNIEKLAAIITTHLDGAGMAEAVA